MTTKKQGVNPYLPSWEYIPDGEPHVFNNRIYIYGSHDRFNGHVFCLNDYVCWSAPIEDLGNWQYEGVIYKKTDDPLNLDSKMCLYAPDVTVGPDGRYYLYYALDKVSLISVAVCDTPAGKYEFYGYVHYSDGTRLGDRDGDPFQFDPGVLTEGDKTYLYTGFCSYGDKSRKGATVTVVGSDMLTIIEEPTYVAPSQPYSDGTGFEGHEFFEAPSIRKKGDTYYFIYSSIVMHELCYATSKHPTKHFKYQGVIVSNNDLNIASYKPAEMSMNYGTNNHGSIVEINGKWYIFYHRHTDGSWFSRQGCAEQIEFQADGTIPQVEITSCGLNGGPLIGLGEYPAYIACNLFINEKTLPTDFPRAWMINPFPKITQDGKDGDEEIGYIDNMQDSATAGFKYFDCNGIKKIKIKVRGYCNGAFEIKTSWNGPSLAKIPVKFTNVWEEYSADVVIPDGKQALYFTYTGGGTASFASFTLE
jgi:arabinoxylan arabinofuranohydrolase